MAEAGGGFVTRSFERMLKDAPGKKYTNLQNALKAYLDRKSELPTSKVDQDEDHSHPDEISQEKVYDEETSAAKEGEIKQMQPPLVVSPPKPTTGQAAAAIMAEAGHTLEGSEADLVLLPLRLAFETKQSKLVEPALDCLHKLISYGHLVGEAGLDGGKNGVMATELFNMVCASSEDEATATDSVRLQVIKVLLTAVASPSFHVHGECLLTAVRTCYNIVLSSKSSVNQATAKATLTQLVNIVFKRMETNTERVEDMKNVISGDVVELQRSTLSSLEVSSGQVSVEELKQFTGHADIKGFEAALSKVVLQQGDQKSGEPMDLESLTVGHRDGVLLLRTICKMAMREETDDLTSRTKILSLELLQGLMESVSDTFTVNYRFIDSVRAYLCYALLRSCVSPTTTIFQLAVNIYVILLQRLRESLKGEIGVFFSLIILRSLDNADSPPLHRTAVLKMLEKICTDSQLLVDIFVNYDCDLESTNLFEHMISSLSRLAQGTPTADPNANAVLYAHQMYLSGSSLQCLVSVVQSLEAWTTKEGSTAANPPSIEDEQESLKGASTEGSEIELAKDEIKITTQADDFEKAKARKISVEAAVVEFNRKPSDGIKYLLEENLVPHDAKAIAQFLHDTPGLDKKQIGDYLGQHEEFQLAVMHAYVDSMKFVGMKFDHALRMFLNGFRLPGEAQKIDRIMEKFAERYCRDNGNLFKNADTAYVLAYAVIMLNTDAHNPMVWPKMTKADFVHINSSTGAEEHAPQELLEEIYDSIVKEEIKLKDEGPSNLKGKPGEKNALLDALNVLNLGGALRRAADDTKKESEEIVKRTQALFKERNPKKGVFHRAEHVELARPMLEVGGWHLLPAFSVMIENTDSKSRVLLCLEGFRLSVHLTKTLGMQNLRYAFLTSLIRFTLLHSPNEMRRRNVDALKTLLGLCQTEPESLANAWNAVLKCISTLEYITTTPFFAGPPGPQVSRDALVLSLTELTGKPTEQVFVNSVKLPSDVIVEFFTALCAVSAEELNHAPPRVFSLTKLVEISYYNMTRIRMVWGRIWAVLSLHFEAAGSHQDEKISMYAIDSLRQLAIKYLERSELANFSFQNDILKPFVVIMRSSKNPHIRALIVECIIQMIKSKVTMIKSGWKNVFMVFTTAAFDDVPWISDAAFENVEQVIMEHFDQVMADSFMDCVNCLFAFANNKSQSSPRTCLKAIAFLRICEDRLAEGQIPGGVSRVVEKGDLEVAEFYWFPILAGLSELTSDPRTEVRNCALEVLFDLLKERGHDFSGPFWDSVFHRVLFPIFEHVRNNRDGEKTESAYQWLRETCIISLRLLCDLFNHFYKEVSFLLPALLGLLLDCATQSDQTLASISMHALVHLTEIGGHQFDAKDWTTLLEHIQSACYKTQPNELLNPANMLTCEPNFPSGYKNSGLVAPVASMRGNRTPTPDDNLPTASQKMKLFDEANGNHGELSHKSIFQTEDTDCSFTDAESEGSEETPSSGFFGSQTHRRRLMVTVMDTILLKNVNFKRGRVVEPPIPTNAPESEDTSDAELDGSEEESPYLQKVRSKCVIQLLLLRAMKSLQRNYWQKLEPSHKLLVMDTLFGLVDFASSYNSNFKLRNRMKELSGDRPPPTLLRQEAEGTQVYLAILNLSIMTNEADEVALKPSRWKLGPKAPNVVGESQKLREEAERRLVAFYGHVLRKSISLQQGPRETVHSDVHKSMALRAPVTVKVLMAMSQMETPEFKKHLPEFYPYFIKLICSDQLVVRKALGDLFNSRIMTLLEVP